MIILGINAYHPDSSACILVDGKIKLAIEEERINDPRMDDRNKLRAGCEFSFGEKTGANAPFSARIGYGMQTFSLGMSIYILFANLEFATYGESVPINNGYVIDRRYITKLTVDILN